MIYDSLLIRILMFPGNIRSKPASEVASAQM